MPAEIRNEVFGLRLRPTEDGAGQGIQLRLTSNELRALFKAARGEPLGPWVRSCVWRALSWKDGDDVDVHSLAEAAARDVCMPLAAFVRLVVLEAAGYTRFREMFERLEKAS